MSDSFDELHAAASHARMIAARLGGDGGVLEQIAAGDWDAELSPTAAVDVADDLRASAERLRASRAWAGGQRSGPAPTGGSGFRRSLDTRLPMNRKERYFTGTVLPMIAASDGFAHLHRLLALCGLDVSVDGRLDGDQDLQFFTEYGFRESVFTAADRERFAGAPTGGDTPDLVLTGPDWLLAIESKLYDWPDAAALTRQVSRQRLIVDDWQGRFGLPPERVRHVLLLPTQLATVVGSCGADAVVTWESVLAAYQGVGPRYWLAVLDEALARYDDLVTRYRDLQFGTNADARLTGDEIVQRHHAGELDYQFMGRSQGLHGDPLATDIATGSWRSREYEVRVAPIESPNWFAIADFVERLGLPPVTG